MGIQAFSIHAHFYQPPREDPITGSIPVERNAAPFTNWNERIHFECYQPNARLRNFERISFNIGPTLYNWMKSHDPLTCARIVDQDKANFRSNGVGNAIAQSYNHTILPLSSHQDKVTQVYWGIIDFEHIFGRKPRGLWLPETAVDYETLEVLANFGIEFTILAPWQAKTGNTSRSDAFSSDIDSSEPYIVKLPNHKQVTVFFYHRELSTRVSFDPWATVNADDFARQILHPSYDVAKYQRNEPQLLLIASDGELYGHHQNYREHFLRRLVDGAASQFDLTPTYPALWLKRYPPRETIEIQERTSWSCHHGVERWADGCSCTSGSNVWKSKLRRAFDHLAGELDRLFLEVTSPFIDDPWLLRHRTIHVMLGEVTIEDLISSMASRALTSEQSRRIGLMLEAQYERQRMFTSCGWFHDDLDRIEPRNNLAYAAQAVRLAHKATGIDLGQDVIRDLQYVVSAKTGLSAEQVFGTIAKRYADTEKVFTFS